MKATLEALKEHFQTVIKANELSHAYLFAEPVNAGAFELAQWLAERLFCIQLTASNEPCGQCSACHRILDQNEPNFQIISSDSRTISIDQIRLLKQELTKSSMSGQLRIFVIQDADKMTAPAANSLLKFLEEPVSQVVIILTTTHLNRILPTIQSRVQTILLQSPSFNERRNQLATAGLNDEVSQLLSQSALPVTEIVDLQKQADLQLMIDTYWRWFNQLLSGSDSAFTQVQAQIVPSFKAKPLPIILQELLVLSFSDLFTLKFHLDKPLQWPQKKTNYAKLVQKITSSQLAKLLDEVLMTKSQLDANVSFQNVLEQLSLKLLAIREENFR